jgi:dolichyl-phosphate-mannose--protein O-mannosyl transferase
MTSVPQPDDRPAAPGRPQDEPADDRGRERQPQEREQLQGHEQAQPQPQPQPPARARESEQPHGQSEDAPSPSAEPTVAAGSARPAEPAEATAPPAESAAPGAHTAPPSPAADAAVATLPDPADPDRADDPALSTHDRLLLRLLGARALLLDATRGARLSGWLWALAVTALGGVLRFWELGRPRGLVFDETYYVKQAYSLLVQGYEGRWADDANALFARGDGSALDPVAEYVVHPPVGKWLIALGIQLGGGIESPTAWRLGSAVAGTLAVLLVARIGRRLLASTALATVAGLLMAVDGTAIVHARTGLLDNFVMLFALAAFGALLLDRDQARRRLAARTAARLDSGAALGAGPGLGWRWWRFAAAVLLGLCVGTKWSGLYFVAVFGLLSVAWDATARRSVGVRRWLPAALWRDAVPAGVVVVLTALATYVATWWSWFAHPGSYLRQWAEQHPGEGVPWLPAPLRSLWHFHTEMWQFHTTLTSEHAYAAHPLGWIIQWRPTSFYYPTSVSGLEGDAAREACGADACSQAITSLGNPVIWWLGTVALVVAAVWLVVRRDWRAGAALSGVVAGWLPWFAYAHRTIFTFYSIAFTPWVILTLVLVLGLLVQSEDPRRRRRGIALTTAVLVLVVAVSAFFYPVWTAWVVPYDFWHVHMWLPTWI